MKKTKIITLAIILTMTIFVAACSNNSAPSNLTTNSTASEDESITDTEVVELFERAVDEIIFLASEDPLYVISKNLENVEVIYDETYIDGNAFYETTATFKELQDFYSNLFTGDALNWILSTKFADVDGVLYVSPAGGATGWRISNLEITLISQNGDTYTYEAVFNEFDITTTSQFAIERTENGYRISSIDYVPYSLK